MKKVLLNVMLAVILTASMLALVGCHGMGETVAEKSDDNARTTRLNGSMLVDDIDAIFGLDRQSRLSEYTSR
jgi:hypothetical protein